ncbi:unnamed protein product, partial [Closterium sp. NIES-53]
VLGLLVWPPAVLRRGGRYSLRRSYRWFARRWGRAAGAGGPTAATGPGGTCPNSTGATGPGGTAEAAGVGPTGGSAGASGGTDAAGSAGTGAAGATGVGAAGGVGAGSSADAGSSEGTGAGGATGAGAPTGSPGTVPTGSGGAPRPSPYFVPLLEQVLGLPPSPGPAPPLECPQPVLSQSLLQPVSPLPAPSPYAGPIGGLAERRAPASRPASPARPACTSRRTNRPRPPAVPGTHQMEMRPSTAPLRVQLPSPPASSLPTSADPQSDSLRAASPALVDFAARCRLDYAASLVAESASVCPPSVGGECALSTDVLEHRQEEFQCFAAALPHLVSTLLAPEGDPDAPDIPTPRSYAEAIEVPYSSQWQSAMDAEMASWKSTGTYVDDVPPPGANIVSGMWLFRVKRPPGSPPVFKARYVARGFSQRQGVDYFQTFSLTPKMTTLRVLLHVAAQRNYELHSLDFSTAFLQGSLHEEIWLRRPPGFTGSFPPGTQWSLRRPVYGLRQAPREWHDTLRTTLAALGFAPSTADPSLFLRTDTSLPPFYILVPLAPHVWTLGPLTTTAATAAPEYYATMALLRVLAFDHESRPVAFDTWLDDLQLATPSQWLSHDAAARLAIRNHLPVAECAHFGQHKTAHALYDAVVALYSSPTTAVLGRLPLPYLFPELSAFATVEDLVSHLRASDARYQAALLAEFLAGNPPPMDHLLSLDPTSLTFDLLEQLLLAAETSAVAVGAARGTPRPPFFEGCSPSPLAPSYASAAALDVSVAEDVGAASASAKHRCSKGKGGKGGGVGSGGGGGGSQSSGGGSGEGGGGSGTGGGSGGSGGGDGGSNGSGGNGGGGTCGGGTGARRVGSGGGQREQQQRRSETQSPQQLREWFLRGASGGSCPYVICTGVRAGQTCEKLHTQHRCFFRLDNVWRAEFGDDVELPRWADLLRSRIAIFDLDFDAILSAMYALSVSAEGDCSRCVPPDPSIATTALGASESGTLSCTVPAQALKNFTLDSGASRCFFCDSTTLTPLPAPVPVRLADPSGGPVVARSSIVLPCPAVTSGSLSGLHLPSFSTNLVSTAALQDAMVTTTTPGGSSPYTLATEPPQVAASAQVSASCQVAASCSCRLLSHQTLL